MRTDFFLVYLFGLPFTEAVGNSFNPCIAAPSSIHGNLVFSFVCTFSWSFQLLRGVQEQHYSTADTKSRQVGSRTRWRFKSHSGCPSETVQREVGPPIGCYIDNLIICPSRTPTHSNQDSIECLWYWMSLQSLLLDFVVCFCACIRLGNAYSKQ